MKNRKSVLRSFLLITQLGLGIIAPVFLCIFIGWFLDSRYGFRSMLWMILLGFLAGGRNGWLLIRETLREDEREREEEERDEDRKDRGDS